VVARVLTRIKGNERTSLLLACDRLLSFLPDAQLILDPGRSPLDILDLVRVIIVLITAVVVDILVERKRGTDHALVLILSGVKQSSVDTIVNGLHSLLQYHILRNIERVKLVFNLYARLIYIKIIVATLQYLFCLAWVECA
jgi:hypothetical protein